MYQPTPIQATPESKISVSHLRDPNLQLRIVGGLFCLLALFAGAVDAWVGRYSMNADGISYLEVAEAYLKGDWNAAINGMWSPFYSWLLGLAVYLANPSPYWEFPFLRLVNFVIYSISLGCFTFFLSEVIRYQNRLQTLLSDRVLFPNWAWVVIGYSLFVWSSIELIDLRLVTPDVCVSALVYLAAGLLIRIKREGKAPRTTLFVYLGFVLGLAYLAKTAMFPFAFVFLTVGMLSIGNLKKNLIGFAIAFASFMLVAGPFIAALSITKGRLTFGDTGKINYAWYVDRAKGRHWQGENPHHGTPKHTTRKIHDEPAVYEFATPIKATYPPWYDPSYWFEGLKVHFSLSTQVRVLKFNLKKVLTFFPRQTQTSALTGLIVGVAVLYCMGWAGRKNVRQVALRWQLVVPAVAALFMYSLVHLEPRYIAPFVVLFWFGIFSVVALPRSPESRRLVTCVSFIISTLLVIQILVPTSEAAYATARDLVRSESSSASEIWQIADGLARMGVQPGDKVVVVGWAAAEAGWAHLARVKIVAEIMSGGWGFDDGDKFWAASETVKAQVYQALAQTDAKVIVAPVPDSVSPLGWQQIGNTTHSAFFLKR